MASRQSSNIDDHEDAERYLQEWAPPGWFEEYKAFSYLCAVKCPPRKAGDLMRLLAPHFPINKRWSHLKRAKKDCGDTAVQVIVAEQWESLDSAQIDLLRPLVVCDHPAEASGPEDSLPTPRCFMVRVPAAPPRTLEEVRVLSELVWPLVFRKSQLTWTPTPLRPEEKREAYRRARRLFGAGPPPSAWVSSARLPICSLRCALYLNGRLVAQADNDALFRPTHLATVADDPPISTDVESKYSVAVSASCNPLRHAIMEALRLLSIQVKEASTAKKPRHRDIVNEGITHSIIRTTIPAQLAEMSTVATTPDDDMKTPTAGVAAVGDHDPDEKAEASCPCPSTSALKASQYYASGCDVFLVGEPCLMCSMALVHSRTSRVFVCTRSEELRSTGEADFDAAESASTPLPRTMAAVIPPSIPTTSSLQQVTAQRYPRLAAFCSGQDFRNRWTGGFGSLGPSLAVQWARPLNHHYPVYLITVPLNCDYKRESLVVKAVQPAVATPSIMEHETTGEKRSSEQEDRYLTDSSTASSETGMALSRTSLPLSDTVRATGVRDRTASFPCVRGQADEDVSFAAITATDGSEEDDCVASTPDTMTTTRGTPRIMTVVEETAQSRIGLRPGR